MKTILDKFQDVKVLVIGDIMIDEYINGIITGISPEAPIPTLKVDNIKYFLGGAGNVANNVRALGASCALIGVVGCSLSAQILKEQLKVIGIKDLTLSSKNHLTTRKTRILNNGVQWLRFDNDICALWENHKKELVDIIQQNFINYDVVIISDYAKGVINFETARQIQIEHDSVPVPIFLDPKFDNSHIYHNFDFEAMTPNALEARQICGDLRSHIGALASKLWDIYDMKDIVITNGSHGCYYFLDEDRGFLNAVNKKPVDVTGAGDTQLATYAVARGAGATRLEAVNLSMVTAGISVGKLGTSVVSRKELEDGLENLQEM